MDYAKWLGSLGAFACLLRMLTLTPGPVRGYVRLGIFVCAAVSLLVGGTAGVLFNRRAPRLTLNGTIVAVHFHSGKHSSTEFKVTNGSASQAFEIDGIRRHVIGGSTAEVVYQGGSNRVLELQVFEEGTLRFEMTDTDLGGASLFVVFIGVVVLAAGVLIWSNNRGAILSTDREGGSEAAADTRASPPGHVDASSLLHLEDRR